MIGDLAAITGGTGSSCRQVAQVAIQGGRHTAANICRRLAGQATRPFRYRDKGIMATIGRRSAVAELPGGIHFRGTLGWLAWLGVHLVFLVGFRNRVVVLVNWAWNYFTWDRGSRVILDDGAADRRAAEPVGPQPARPETRSTAASGQAGPTQRGDSSFSSLFRSAISSRSLAAYSKRRSAAASRISSSRVEMSRASSSCGSSARSLRARSRRRLRRSRPGTGAVAVPATPSMTRMSVTALRIVWGSMPCSAL